MNVLIADDNAEELNALAEVATLHGHDVVACANGAEALEAFAWFEPSLIILDLEMPRMDGFEVASQLRIQYPERLESSWLIPAEGQRHFAIRPAN